MEEKEIKNSLTSLLLVVSIFVIIALVSYICIEKSNYPKQMKGSDIGISNFENEKDNLNEKTYKESENAEIDNRTNNNQTYNYDTARETIDLDNYLGMWYESENTYSEQNPNDLNIKNISNNKLLMDMYITRTADFDNFEVTMNGKTGTFEAFTDNGCSSDGQPAKINGKIEIYNNNIKISILKSNVIDLESGNIYTFKYHIKNSNIDNYKGTWYESQKNSGDKNPNSLQITNIDKNKILFDLYITRTADFDNVTVYISNDFGTFEAITDNGISKDGGIGKVDGYVELKNNTIKLAIGQSNVIDIDSGTEINFTYKKN